MSRFYFDAKDASGNYGLWVSDGTQLGTKEIVPGTQGTKDLDPFYWTSIGAKGVFSGTDSTGDNGLWVTGRNDGGLD